MALATLAFASAITFCASLGSTTVSPSIETFTPLTFASATTLFNSASTAFCCATTSLSVFSASSTCFEKVSTSPSLSSIVFTPSNLTPACLAVSTALDKRPCASLIFSVKAFNSLTCLATSSSPLTKTSYVTFLSSCTLIPTAFASAIAF